MIDPPPRCNAVIADIDSANADDPRQQPEHRVAG